MESTNSIKEYSNGEVTVVWEPARCIHSTVCWKEATGLPQVFNPRVRPWVNIKGGSTEQIVAQVQKCPSGALRFYYNADANLNEAGMLPANAGTTVVVMRNGPLLVQGTITVKDLQGNETTEQNVTAFCRCGLSGNKPYCDGSHAKTRIDD